MRVSIDIETALYDLLTAAGYSASAHTIPAKLGRTLPHVHVVRTGGFAPPGCLCARISPAPAEPEEWII